MIDPITAPANLRIFIHKAKKEPGLTGLTRNQLEVLTSLYTVSSNGLGCCSPKMIAERLHTLNRKDLYRTLPKLEKQGFIKQVRKPIKFSTSNFSPARSGLYCITEKGKELIQYYRREMTELDESVRHGYFDNRLTASIT